jgi:hypothetical protein
VKPVLLEASGPLVETAPDEGRKFIQFLRPSPDPLPEGSGV